MTCRDGVALLQGPPGTGKTKTLLAILAAFYSDLAESKGDVGGLKRKILVCAPSNAAVDEIAARVLKEGLPRLDGSGGVVRPSCLRVGNPRRITRPEVVEISLEDSLRTAERETSKRQKDDYFSKNEELRGQLNSLNVELESLYSLQEAEVVQAAFDEKSDLSLSRKYEELLNRKKFLSSQKARLNQDFDKQWSASKKTTQASILQDSDIVFATLSSSAADLLSTIEFECVITGKEAYDVSLFLEVFHSGAKVSSLCLMG